MAAKPQVNQIVRPVLTCLQVFLVVKVGIPQAAAWKAPQKVVLLALIETAVVIV